MNEPPTRRYVEPDGLTPDAAPPRWGLGDVLGGLATSVSLPLAMAALVFGLGDGFGLSQTWTVVLFALSTWAGLVAWTFASSYTKGAHSLRDDFGWSFRGADVLRGVGAGIGALVATGVVIALLVDDVSRPEEGLLAVRPEGAGELIAFGALVILGAPLVEELFFRGLFLRSAQRRLGTTGAVFATSIVFGLVHIPDRAAFGLALAFAPPFFLGLVLAFLAVRTGRLGSSVVAHMSVNALAFIGGWLAPAIQS